MKALIQTSSLENASGDIQKGYDFFKNRGVDMPQPMELMTASPGYFSIMFNRALYFSNHPALSFSLLAHIRYFSSCSLDYGFCRLFNKEQLKKMGMTEEDFQAMGDDPHKSLLEEKDQIMLSFVVRAMDDPEAIAGDDIEKLRAAGWTDADMLDALAQGVGMKDHSIFMRVFKPGAEQG